MAALDKYSLLKAQRIDLRSAIPLAKPFAVLFEPTSLCNFKCACCFHSEPDIYRHLPKGSMKFGDFRKIADDLAAWDGPKLKVIRIIGFGEPLLNPHTPEIVAYLRKKNVADRIEITTNASLLTSTVARQLIDAGLDYLRCSIYAVDQKRHEELTRSKTSVKTIKDNISALKALRGSSPFIYVKMLKSSDESENARFLEEYSRISDEAALETPHQWLSSAPAGGLKARNVCPQPFKMLSVHFNGDVILCDPDWKGNTRVGNALLENISRIWGGPAMRKFWKMHLETRRHENESCRNCSFLMDEYAIDNLDGVSPDVLGEG